MLATNSKPIGGASERSKQPALNGNVTSRVDTTVSPNPEIVVIPLSDDEVANATIAAAGKIAAVKPVSSSISVTGTRRGLFVFSQEICSCH